MAINASIDAIKSSGLSEKDIDLVVNYFHKEINDNKAILRCNVSESLKQVKCDVLGSLTD